MNLILRDDTHASVATCFHRSNANVDRRMQYGFSQRKSLSISNSFRKNISMMMVLIDEINNSAELATCNSDGTTRSIHNSVHNVRSVANLFCVCVCVCEFIASIYCVFKCPST